MKQNQYHHIKSNIKMNRNNTQKSWQREKGGRVKKLGGEAESSTIMLVVIPMNICR